LMMIPALVHGCRPCPTTCCTHAAGGSPPGGATILPVSEVTATVMLPLPVSGWCANSNWSVTASPFGPVVLPVTVVSRDKDLAQLIAPGDVFWDYSDAAEYRYEQIAARFGVQPERMADYLALRGDSVDNVPGVPGVGAKTAALLMTHCASLEQLFEQLDAIARLPMRGAASLPARLLTHRAAAFQARALTRIVCDVPMAARHADLRRRAPDLAQIQAFCDTQGFGALLPRQAERLIRSS